MLSVVCNIVGCGAFTWLPTYTRASFCTVFVLNFAFFELLGWLRTAGGAGTCQMHAAHDNKKERSPKGRSRLLQRPPVREMFLKHLEIEMSEEQQRASERRTKQGRSKQELGQAESEAGATSDFI